MAWRSIGLVKNALNEYKFCIIPNINNFYNDPVGGTNTVIRIGGLRQNYAEGTAQFQEGLSYVTDINSQTDIFNAMIDPLSGDDTFVYSTVGGDALRLKINTTSLTWFWQFEFEPYKYTNNMQSQHRLLTYSSNTLKDQSKNQFTHLSWGLLWNDETEQAYLMVISSTLYWNYAVDTPDYYDSAEVVITVCDSNITDDNLYTLFRDSIPGGGGGDPYAAGGYSAQDGGGGDFDDTSDAISVPSAPLLNLTLNGFISAYVPSITDINDLADWIWGNYDKFDSTKVLGKIFTEPMESILSLHMLPYTPGSSTAVPVTIGNFATGLSMKPLLTQFEDIPCGSLTFTEFWGNYLDYNPFTKIILCLPYVGQVDLDPDEVMGKTVKVLYRVDNLTGAFVCFVYIDGDKILGQYSGSCILTVPVTAGSYAALNAAVLSIAATAAGGFGGAVGSAIGGGYGGMLAAKEGLKLGAGALGETMSSAAGNVNGMKLKVSHSGGLTGASGFMGAQTPYAIIHRPRQSVPENFNQFAGYPSNITMTLEDCSGFTSVRTCVYDGLPFTDAEIKELDEILKGGVFI